MYELPTWCYSMTVTSHRYYLGRSPQIMISDLDILKQIMVKDFDNFADHAVSSRCHSGLFNKP